MCVALVNGALVDRDSASVSIFDRGFLFADSVYEVIPVYAGQPFRGNDHLARLARSLAALGIANPYTDSQWRAWITRLIEANDSLDSAVYIQVSRGAPARREHRIPTDCSPTVVAFCQPRTPPSPQTLASGVAAITHNDTRWKLCKIKSTSLLANVLATSAAHTHDANEAILIDNGVVREGSSSNLFAVIDGEIVTPALGDMILPGITRGVVIDLVRESAHPAREVEHLTQHALRNADEIWLTSSTREILPVTRLDDQPVGTGRPGPVWSQVYRQLQSARDE